MNFQQFPSGKPSEVLWIQHQRSEKSPFRSWRKYVALLITLIFLFQLARSSTGPTWHYRGYWPTSSLKSCHKNTTAFSWDNITPSKDLQFHACFDEYQCARLDVPLDWNSTSADGPRAAIAIIKRPAAVPVTHAQYGGPILFNFGGPGNSGVKGLLVYGKEFSTIFDPTIPFSNTSAPLEVKYFDMISFDDRGINNTTPNVDCITNPLARQVWNSDGLVVGGDVDNPSVLANVWARERAFGAVCSFENSKSDKSEVGRFVSTASVVRDMVEIIEQHGAWREKTAQSLLQSHAEGDLKREALTRTAWQKGAEKLQYWGFSYGTVLGQTFATLQPHRVGRMVLDGNVDADDYARTGWTTNLYDIDAITEAFASTCYTAGPRACEFYHPAGAAQVHANFHALLQALRDEPLGTILSSGAPGILTYSNLVDIIFEHWYNTHVGFPTVASILATLSPHLLHTGARPSHNTTTDPLPDSLFRAPESTCATPPAPIHPRLRPLQDSAAPGTAIRCSDGDDVTHLTRPEDFAPTVARLGAQSALFGPRWSLIVMPCTAYALRAKWRHAGPFGARRTANPILFATAEFDPVTPLANARLGRERFPGAGVLVVGGSPGHCTISGPSLAALEAVRAYFVEGTVAEGEVVVEASVRPFRLGREERPEGVGAEIWETVVSLAQGFPNNLHKG